MMMKDSVQRTPVIDRLDFRFQQTSNARPLDRQASAKHTELKRLLYGLELHRIPSSMCLASSSVLGLVILSFNSAHIYKGNTIDYNANNTNIFEEWTHLLSAIFTKGSDCGLEEKSLSKSESTLKGKNLHSRSKFFPLTS